MRISEAIELFQNHQRSTLRPRTIASYRHFLQRFESQFGEHTFDSVKADDLWRFLETLAQNLSKSTRHLRYTQLKSFYNFCIEKRDLNIRNPCATPLLSKAFKRPKQVARRILDKEMVEEMVYNAKNPRDRLIVELQARCGLRIGESLKIKVSDVTDRKLTLREPKSGRESEIAFMPEQIAKRLQDYVKQSNLGPEDRLFPICYSTARGIIRRLGSKLNLAITPHDLRRYSATYASRSGVPLEIVSKIILRHQDLKTTQAYLGKVAESEAIRWMDMLHGR